MEQYQVFLPPTFDSCGNRREYYYRGKVPLPPADLSNAQGADDLYCIFHYHLYDGGEKSECPRKTHPTYLHHIVCED